MIEIAENVNGFRKSGEEEEVVYGRIERFHASVISNFPRSKTAHLPIRFLVSNVYT